MNKKLMLPIAIVIILLISAVVTLHQGNITQGNSSKTFQLFNGSTSTTDESSSIYLQTIKMDKNHLKGVFLMTKRIEGTSGYLKMYLMEDGDIGDGKLIATSKVPLILIPTSKSPTAFSFNVDLVKGRVYQLAIFFDNADSNALVNLYGSDTDTYNDGSLYKFTFGWVNTHNDLYMVIPTTNGEEPPVADFTWTPQNPKSMEIITFDGSKSTDDDGVSEYRWKFGDSWTSWSSYSTQKHVYTSEGTYTATLEVKDTDGYTDQKEHTITVSSDSPPPPETYTLTVNTLDTDANIIKDATVKVTGQSSKSSGEDGVATFHYLDSGTYTVEVSKYGYEDWSKSITISDNDAIISSANRKSGTNPPDNVLLSFVVRDNSGSPVSSANIYIKGNTTYNAITDDVGKASITVEPGIYDIIISHVSYDSSALSSVSVSSDQEIEVTLTGGGITASINIFGIIISIVAIILTVVIVLVFPLPTTLRLIILIFGVVMSITLYFMISILGVTL